MRPAQMTAGIAVAAAAGLGWMVWRTQQRTRLRDLLEVIARFRPDAEKLSTEKIKVTNAMTAAKAFEEITGYPPSQLDRALSRFGTAGEATADAVATVTQLYSTGQAAKAEITSTARDVRNVGKDWLGQADTVQATTPSAAAARFARLPQRAAASQPVASQMSPVTKARIVVIGSLLIPTAAVIYAGKTGKSRLKWGAGAVVAEAVGASLIWSPFVVPIYPFLVMEAVTGKTIKPF